MQDNMHYTNLLNDEVFGVICHNGHVYSVRTSEVKNNTEPNHTAQFSHKHGLRWRVFDGKVLYYDDSDFSVEDRDKIRSHLEREYKYKFLGNSDFVLDMKAMKLEVEIEKRIANAIENFKKTNETEVMLSASIDVLKQHKDLIIAMIAEMVFHQDRWESHFSEPTVRKIYKMCDGVELQEINEHVKPIEEDSLRPEEVI